MGRLAKVVQGQSQPSLKAFKKGGAVHDDAKMDAAQIKKMVKPDALKKACGGKVKK